MNYFNPLAPSSPLSELLAPFPNLYSALNSTAAPPLPTPALAWIAVRQRFTQFHNNLSLTPAQFLDGMTKRNGVVNALIRRHYGYTSDTDNSFLVGSWSRGWLYQFSESGQQRQSSAFDPDASMADILCCSSQVVSA